MILLLLSIHINTPNQAGLQVCDFKGKEKTLMDSDWTVSCKLDGGHRQMPGGDNKGWGLITGQLPSRPSPCPGDGGLAHCPVLQPPLDLGGFASQLSGFTNLISSRSHRLPVRNEQLWYSRGANKVSVDLSNPECRPPFTHRLVLCLFGCMGRQFRLWLTPPTPNMDVNIS